MSNGKGWSLEETAILVAGIHEIANTLGRSSYAVAAKACKAQLAIAIAEAAKAAHPPSTARWEPIPDRSEMSAAISVAQGCPTTNDSC